MLYCILYTRGVRTGDVVFVAVEERDGVRSLESSLQRAVDSAAELVHRRQRPVLLRHPEELRLKHVQSHRRVQPWQHTHTRRPADRRHMQGKGMVNGVQ